MIVITGAAGFIGSCLVAKLNELGRHDLIVIDHYASEDDPSRKNLSNKKYVRYFDKAEFLKLLKRDQFDYDVECIFHMGACSSTTASDVDYFQKNNYEYSITVAEWALKYNARYIYASSAATYGAGELGYDDDENQIPNLKPLNLYGHSKQQFDEWVLRMSYQNRMVGLKFFNVFGPNEYHKGDMQSVIAKSYNRVVSEGKMVLFKSHNPAFRNGEQKRDFIYIKDVVAILLFFMNHKDVNGIYNVATGKARTWNDLAQALFASVGKQVNIEYVDMPVVLRDKYQYFTEGNIQKLQQAGYHNSFMSLEEAIKDYTQYLKQKTIL